MEKIDIIKSITERCGGDIYLGVVGAGLGKIMLSIAIEKLSVDYPVVKKLVAKVKPENIASLKVFENNGFEAKFQQLEFEIG